MEDGVTTLAICGAAILFSTIVIIAAIVSSIRERRAAARRQYLAEHRGISLPEKKPSRTWSYPANQFLFVDHYVRMLRKQDGVVDVVKVAHGPLHHYQPEGHFFIEQLNGANSPWMPVYAVYVAHDELRLYMDMQEDGPYDTIPTENIRWYGRPVKYSDGENEIWLHVEHKSGWYRYRLFLNRGDMQRFVRVIKRVTPDDMVKAYRRRRPYVHYGPVTARPATQDIHGAWELDAPRTLYLMPLYLVVLNGPAVQRTLRLDAMQEIQAGARLDVPDADGLVQFMVEGEKVAFTLPKYEALAESLAEAAKRSLEDPIQRKSKKKDDDEDFDEDDP